MEGAPLLLPALLHSLSLKRAHTATLITRVGKKSFYTQCVDKTRSSNTSLPLTIFQHGKGGGWGLGCWHLFYRCYGYYFMFLAFPKPFDPDCSFEVTLHFKWRSVAPKNNIRNETWLFLFSTHLRPRIIHRNSGWILLWFGNNRPISH